MYYWRWLISKTVRQAAELRRQIWKYLNAQRDILKPEAVAALEQAVVDLQKALASPLDRKALQELMVAAEKTANQHLKAYPHASLRENIDVVLVAVAVALGVRTFFLQPFKIPTGSMQPTLYGITHPLEDLRGDESVKFPTGVRKWVDSWFYGISYYHVKARSAGEIEELRPVKTVFPLIKKQEMRVGNEWYTIWFPPDQLERRARLEPGMSFKAGDDIIKTWVKSGDHLFVDRLTYNFRPPKRGEIVVFETRGIDGLPKDQFYIKRLVALGDERVRLGNDQHLIINGERLDAATPHFEQVYSFSPAYAPDHYFGHVNGAVARRYTYSDLAPMFADESVEQQIKRNHYMVMGDNTLHSDDSRRWGMFPKEKMIGKSAFVYWPISSRFGWSHR